MSAGKSRRKLSIESYFGVRAAGSTVTRECLGGLTTFLTMSYIVVVNPVILTAAGMPADGAFLGTVLASAFATLLMGLLANVPVALAPGMGMNAFFAFTLCVEMKIPWQTALGIVVVVSIVFFILTVARIRTVLTAAVPTTLRFAAAVGIGLFITLIGLKHAGIVVHHPETLVTLGDVTAPHTAVALAGLALTLVLLVRNVATAIFWGMLATAAIGAFAGLVRIEGAWVQMPSGQLPGMEVRILEALNPEYISAGITLLFFALFDAMGTLYAVGAEAKLLDERGNFPRLGRALMVDAGGALAGGLLGTSSVTCYIESATGVSVGARTGLACVVTAICFLGALFFMPLIGAIGAGVQVGAQSYYPVTAPALITVGILMTRNVVRIDWSELTESVPAFFTIVIMPFTFSIASGLAAGFCSYALLKLCAGKGREVHWLVYVLALLFAVQYAVMAGG